MKKVKRIIYKNFSDEACDLEIQFKDDAEKQVIY